MQADAATPTPNVSAPARLTLLDGMRGVAAMAVMVYHAHHLGLVPKLMGRGYLFVEFFFLLGGFVFALGSEAKLRDGAIQPLSFLRKRFRRLWPVMAIGVAAGFVQFALAGRALEAATYLPAALLLIPAFWIAGKELFPLNGPHWYLSWEMIANAVNAVVLSRLRTGWVGAFVLAMGAWLALSIVHYGSNEFGMVEGRWLPGMPRTFFSVGLGLLIGRLVRDGGLPGWLRLPWPIAALAPLTLLATLPFWGLRVWLGDVLVVLMIMPLLFAASVNAKLPERWTPFFVASGRISYPLYAVHLPILLMASRYLEGGLATLVALGGSIAAAALIAVTIERR